MQIMRTESILKNETKIKSLKSEYLARAQEKLFPAGGNDVFLLKSKHQKLSRKICRIASTQRKNKHPVEISLFCNSKIPYF